MLNTLANHLTTTPGPWLLSAAAVMCLVVCDQLSFIVGRFLFKPLAAAAFIWLAVSAGALQSTYGIWLLAGLALCACGDLLLMPESRRSFLAGLIAFLLGHIVYLLAFIQLGTSLTGAVLSALPAAALLILAAKWLLPHLDKTMKLPVMCYMVVITSMLVAAGATYGQSAATAIIVGAWGFAVSDLAVSRQQFVQHSRVNGLWGSPLYFGSQMLLASSLLFI